MRCRWGRHSPGRSARAGARQPRAQRFTPEPYFDWDSFQEIVREPVRVECAGAGVSIHA